MLHAPRGLLMLGGGLEYYRKVLSVQPSKLVGYWPMSEASGSVATDLSPQANNGAYTGVDLAQPGIGDGRVCPWFDGTNDFNNIYSAGLAADFNVAEGTLMVWYKVNSVAVWTDATSRILIRCLTDASNLVSIQRHANNNTMGFYYIAGGTNKNVLQASLTSLEWNCYVLTWSVTADEAKPWINGVQQGATLTGLGTWSGALGATTCNVGATSTVPANVAHGWLAHAAIWNTPLTLGEITYLARVH